MSKELKALEYLIAIMQNQITTIIRNEKDEEKKRKFEKLTFELMFEDKAVIEKGLKALDIIKEKSVDVGFLQYCSTVETYNNYIIEHAWTRQTKKLTKEEFGLLKEALI